MICLRVVVLALSAAVARSADVSPVEKVVQMMEDLQTEVITEGKKEATTYDKFACFCKDTQSEKTTAITEAEDTISSLTASINQLTSDRDDLDADIAEYNAKIELTVKEMKEATAERAEQKATFEKELAELEKGQADVDGAVETLKTSEAFVSVKSVIKTIRQAVLMADAMGNGPKHQHVIAELLQSDQPEVPMDNYQGGRAGDIIDTVEDLDKDFIEKIAEIKKVETQRLADFDLYMQLKTDTKKKTEASLADAQEQKAKKMEGIGQDNQELSDTNAQLLDDQAYIKDLASKCSLKSR